MTDTLRLSKWTFSTSNGGNLAVGVAAAEGGSITLMDPDNKPIKFYYAALGIGVGVGIKMPKLGKFKLPGTSGSSESMSSYGTVYISPDFNRSELTASDIEGACLFGEATAALAWGHSGYVMSFGLSTSAHSASILDPLSRAYGHQRANGYLRFHGFNYGLQAGLSATAFLGYMHT
jgi:hypothetical protein